jgi:hypothetical protein
MTAFPILASAPRKGRVAIFLALAAPSLAIYFVAHLGMWPAQMTPDSFTQWNYAQIWAPMDDLHSGFHVLAIRLIVMLWRSPAAVVLVHYVYLAAVTALVLVELRRWGVPDLVVAATAVLFPLFPANLFMSSVLWIDVPYSASLVLCLYFLLVIARTRGEALRRWPFAIGFGCALGLVGLLRTNGLIAAPLIGLAALICYRRVAASLGVGLVLITAFKLVIYPALAIEPFPSGLRGLPPLHVVGAYVANSRLPSGDDAEFVGRILPLDTIRSLYQCEANSLLPRPAVQQEAMTGNAARLWMIAGKLILQAPSIYVRHLICTTALLWKPVTLTPTVIGLPPLEITVPYIEFRPKLPLFHSYLREIFAWTIENGPRRWLFWLPANAFYLVLATAGGLAIARRQPALLLLAAPAVATTLAIAPLMGVPAYRYQYGVTMMALLLAPLLAARHPAPNDH